MKFQAGKHFYEINRAEKLIRKICGKITPSTKRNGWASYESVSGVARGMRPTVILKTKQNQMSGLILDEVTKIVGQ